MTPPLLDLASLNANVSVLPNAPFPCLLAAEQLPMAMRDQLVADFPSYREAGFFPYDEAECGPSIQQLVAELTGREFADALGAKLELPGLGDFPTLVTLCRSLNRRHGTIHTDSRSKLGTALLYLQPSWPDISGGCLRYLQRIDDIDALVAPEIRPLYGTLTAFKRSDCSFHGHLPHEGERLVIQVAWLTSEREKLRKTSRGRFSRWLKSLLGSWDRRWGAGRDRNAAHPR